MIKVLRIGHATFETPDLAKAIEHYTQVIGLSLAGREDKRAFLATKIGLLAVELQQGPQALWRRTERVPRSSRGMEPIWMRRISGVVGVFTLR